MILDDIYLNISISIFIMLQKKHKKRCRLLAQFDFEPLYTEKH